MHINQLTIRNFRNIGNVEKTFKLNPSCMVFIGVNGKGKSTILHALRVVSGAFFLAIPEVKSRHIQREEIHLEEVEKQLLSIFPVKVEASASLPGVPNEVVWRRQWLPGKAATTSHVQDVGSIKKIALEKYHKVMQGDDKVDLPVIAFFGISRAVGAGRLTTKSRIQRLGRMIFKEGYQDWEEMRAVKFHYDEWLSTYDTLVTRNKEYSHTKEAFYRAVKTANPYIKEIDFVNGELWLQVEIEDSTTDFMPISMHSDGLHYFTAMIAEIAYRCVVLNGYLNEKAIEESTGVVMIDELDLHLHPNWQRHVLHDLKKAFPKIQFVATTHSPFIVQSLQSDEVWNLDKMMDVSPKDLDIGTVATAVMGVPSEMADENKEVEDLSTTYLELLKGNNFVSLKNISNALDDIELRISDPAARAFLKMKRLEKESKHEANQ